jgi:hypothetical protein
LLLSRIRWSVTSIGLASPPPEMMILTVGAFGDAARGIPSNIAISAGGTTKSVFFTSTSAARLERPPGAS